MGADEGLALADQLIFQATQEYLSDLRQQVFRLAWDGRTYEEIATALGYNETYIREEGATLFRLLSEALPERVTKPNFRAALERYSRSISPPIVSQPVTGSLNSEVEQGNDPNFLGRSIAVDDLNRLIRQRARLIVIQGEGGQGKTTLARKYFETQPFDFRLDLWMATETQNITPVESVVEEWLRRDFNEEPGRDFGINLERLKRKLRDDHCRIGVLIDNLEPALDRDGRFIPAHRRYVDLLRMLADPSLNSVTLITSREQLYESSIGGERYILDGLAQQVWRQYFQNQGLDGQSPAISAMCHACGGNAKAMKILSGAIRKDYDGNIEAYWQENRTNLLLERELKDLVSSQFDRLQQLDPDAYHLLCRLGCYRYQDIPWVPLEGVTCLLQDVPVAQHQTTIRALHDRSLLEVRKAVGKYWLHPVLRTEAIARLRLSPDWETINRRAAQFWTDHAVAIQTIDDALTALEAYYHYLEIADFEQACDVLLEMRLTRWGESVPLGWIFHRLRLFQQIIAPINDLIPQLPADLRLGKLYNLLGYIYRLQGRLPEAINCHQQGLQLAYALSLSSLQVQSLFNLGLCQRDLGAYEESFSCFESLLALTYNSSDADSYCTYALGCLAYLHSCVGQRSQALQTLEAFQQQIACAQLTTWGQSYSWLFSGSTYRNLGLLEQATECYQQTLALADQHDFSQIRAKAINGMAQIYREQQQFEQALTSHTEAIDLLNKIVARGDLADAHYQLGLTYQRLQDHEKAQTCLQTALDLFTEMQAWGHCDRVRQAL